jgi:RNA polymerase sigma-70 factor (ECF subfamily)
MVVTHDEQDFITLADPYRRELLAHCYRMMGSVNEAEDLVQETYLRAWKAYDRFEGRSSLRTWLYRIATSTCLTSLRSRALRPLPTGLGGPTDNPAGDLIRGSEVPWLEPVPDAMVGAAPDDPAVIVTSRESIRLALIAALQHLPPRQRVVLILRDVLKWRAAEVADLLETTTTVVNSILQRARAQLDQVSPNPDEVVKPNPAEQRDLLERYVQAFESYDVAAIVDLLRNDAVWEMPPFFAWVRGAEQIGRLISAHCPARGPGDLRLLPTGANGQPGFGMYLRDEGDGGYRPFGLHVVDTVGGAVRHVAVFFDSGLFGWFGLPKRLPAAG